MYLAQLDSTSQTQAPYYINILENILKDVNFKNRNDIDSAIKEAKDIATGNKEIFSISNNHYFLVTTLLVKFKKDLLVLKGNDFDKKTYSSILDILR